jgi:dienelactone hydrolase
VTELATRDLEYTYNDTRLIGYFVAEPETKKPGLILLHDATGVSPAMEDAARRAAALGYSVLLADLWGERRIPQGPDEIGQLIGGLVGDQETWMGRIRAAHQELLAQPEVDADNVAAFGYCFGGSSGLEYARVGGDVKGVVSFHGGLDRISTEWTPGAAAAKILVLTGADDPMASPDAVGALQAGLTAAGVDWEVASYGATKHAFTSPDVDKLGRPDLAYNARADRRSWNAFTFFLEEIFEASEVTEVAGLSCHS